MAFEPALVTSLLDASVVAYASRPCTYFLGRRLSFAEIGRLSDQAAKGLQQLGVGEGVKVGLLLPKIGGTAEEEAAEYVSTEMTKAVAGFIAGTSAPPGKRMGHAGAIVSGGKGTAEAKIKAMNDAGIVVAETPSDMGEAMIRALG
jgi:succinyl-CoA synthetase alpha subunit